MILNMKLFFDSENSVCYFFMGDRTMLKAGLMGQVD